MSLRVLHVIRGLANSSGTTHIVNPLAEAQSRLGARVCVAFVDKPNAPAVEPDPALVDSHRFRLSIQLNNPGISVPFARALPKLVTESDVVHVHAIWNFPSWWAMRCASRAGRPYIVAPQGSFDPWAMRQNALGKRIYGALTEMPYLRKATRMQALSEKEVAQFRHGGLSGPVSVIPNGIAGDMFADGPARGSLARELDLPSGGKTLLFLSRVHPKKGLDMLIKAFAKVRSDYPAFVLVVAGGDAGSGYLKDMRQLAGGLGLGERVRFVGEVAGETKRDMLMGADAYALISHSEGLPVAAIEALGAGLPCVLSHECNLPVVAERRAGWLVEPSIEAAAEGLRELMSDADEATARGRRAGELVEEQFTWDRIAAQTLDVYGEMFGG